MEKRLQTINNDTILEISETVPTKRRLSKNSLEREIANLTESIARFQAQLRQAEADLALITTAQNEADRA